jgi:hypothetical protein
VLTAGAFVSGCVATPRLKSSIPPIAASEATPPMPDIDRLGVFVDGMVEYAGMNGSFLDVADSRAAVARLAEQTNAALAQEGYTVAFTETPFVGGLLEQSSLQVAQNRDGKPQVVAPPFDAARGIDPGYETALRNLSESVAEAFAHPRNWSPAAKDGIAVIAAQKHIRYLLVVQGYGHIESGLRQATEGIGTAALTALFTLGTVAVSVRNVSWLNSQVMLIDLETADIVWSNSVFLKNLNPVEPRDYERGHWTGQIFYGLPKRGKSANAPSAAAG